MSFDKGSLQNPFYAMEACNEMKTAHGNTDLMTTQLIMVNLQKKKGKSYKHT